MREHDALPRLARLVGCYAVSVYDADSCAYAVELASPGAPSAVLARALALLDEYEGENTFRLYGPDHPECPQKFRKKRTPKGAWWAAASRRAR